MASDRGRLTVIAALGTAQTLAWASSYYLIAILSGPIARDLETAPTVVYAAFSAALMVAAVLGPRVGRTIDIHGGRSVLVGSNLLFAAGLVMLATAGGQAAMWAGWLLIGAGMGLGLYDAAFAALGRIYGMESRSAITGITLLAGFASTVGWPLTGLGLETIGWRSTCLAWAAAHIIIGLPLNGLMLPKCERPLPATPTVNAGRIVMDRTMWLLSYTFAAGWVVSTAMAAHLPRLLEATGASAAMAVAAGALIGPAQVAARLIEAGPARRLNPLLMARASAMAHPLGAMMLLGGAGMGYLFTVLHGMGNGILTIARGTVPMAIYGPKDYGQRLGVLGAPSRIAQAFAPLGFGLVIDALGSGALVVSSLVSLSALAALLMIPAKAHAGEH